MPPFDHLFSPLAVGPRTIRNRIFSTGHQTMLFGGDALPDDRFVAYHEARARGGAGLIVTEAALIHPTMGAHAIDISTDACIPACPSSDDLAQIAASISGASGSSCG